LVIGSGGIESLALRWMLRQAQHDIERPHAREILHCVQNDGELGEGMLRIARPDGEKYNSQFLKCFYAFFDLKIRGSCLT